MTAHTPGPWYDMATRGWPAGRGAVRAADGRTLRYAVEDKGDEAAANARLIAAAPDLLAALVAGLEPNALQCSFAPQADDPAICCCGRPKAYHWKAAARAAIARAEGRP